MVKRNTFEKELLAIIVPAVGHAQDVMASKYGVKFEIQVDWQLTTGHFEDEEKAGVGG